MAYTVGQTLKNGTKVTASNVGALNNSIATGNSRWTNAADLAPVSNSTAQQLTNSFYKVGDVVGGGGGDTKTPTQTPTGGTQAQASGGGFNAADYLSGLFESYAAQRQAALQAAYDRSRANIENAFGESRGLLDANYNSSVNAMNSSYNNSLRSLNDDAAKSLREAYVNKMLSQKNLGQKMSAMGLSGGATETTLANMLNNYGNARNNINTTLNSNIADLDATRDSNMASILQNYNSNLMQLLQQRANALVQIENALSGGMADALGQQFSFQTSGGYLNALNDALKNMNAFQGVATSANNDPLSYSINQTNANDVTQATNYEKFMEMLRAAGFNV